MAPLHSHTAPLHPFPGSSVPPLPTLPIILPPVALCAILLILYIRRPAAIVPTRPMANIRTPLLTGTARTGNRIRVNRRAGSYGGLRAPNATSSDEDLEDGTGKGDGRPAQPRGWKSDKRPTLVRRVDEDILVDASIPSQDEERNPLSDSVPTLFVTMSGGENDSSDDQGPSTPGDETTPIHFPGDRVTKVKGVEVLETEVVETPAEERTAPVGMAVNVLCV